MSTQRFVLSTVAGGVTLFVLGGIFYGWLLMDFFMANAGTAIGAMKEIPDWFHLVLGELMFAVLLTTVLGKWARVSGAGQGFTVGATFGLLLSVAMGLTFIGTMNITTPAAAAVDVVVSTIRTGVAGAVIGAVIARR
jgi:hypothetical protein